MTLLKWRTVIAVLLLGLILLVGLLIALSAPTEVAAFVSTMYIAFASAVVGLAATLAGKSSIEHLAGGSGVRGAISVLMTNAKPEPEQTEKPAEVKP